MLQVLRGACPVAIVGLATLAFAGAEARAQDTFINQNISGFNLPGVQLPQGHDEVRAADGTTCRSAVGGSGAYIDVGIIGNPEQNAAEGSMSAYGRVVIPLGSGVKRLDCSRLYDLEVQRLEMELKLMQMGLSRGISPVSEGEDGGAEAVTEAAPAETEEAPAEIAAKEEATEKAEAPKEKAKPAEEMKVAAAKPKKGDSSWADEGWSTEGLKK